ncbi:nuclear transport factor 2 family protein [Altericroceibacterium endophyticum]|uniref:Nuclear transport factor 2 family protein n=1 Tax=Altericroceibacterium endophyticum TaxID=1808508 RepID=A0A6I4T1Z2_9SPHN|nr:nuclear transport factor 2 family protein [Altericroceibacterium endophyticum]MXO65244.1 nuclear transport factor 2 family protein [Altericroceibacterium endophyticum]
MTRDDYARYVEAFNNRDYDAVFDFYVDDPRIAFFGVEITTREQLKDFYGFLHRFVKESVTVERYANSDELAAVEGIVRVEGIADLTREELDRKGLTGLFPIAKGEVQEMRQYIHYHLRGGKIESVGCALVA